MKRALTVVLEDPRLMQKGSPNVEDALALLLYPLK